MNARAVLIGTLLVATLTAPREARAQDAGRATVHGTITIPAAAPRRVANRYAGAGSGAAQTLQVIAPVVYLRGAVSSAPPPARVFEMAQQDTAFVPNLLLVPRGASVEFPNRDDFFHNVFSYSKTKRFDLGRFPNPESKAVVFDETGVVNVFCEIHKSMRAVIIVTEDPRFAAEVRADGSYAIANVPAGSYELVVWHVDRGTKTQRIQVPSTGSVRVDVKL